MIVSVRASSPCPLWHLTHSLARLSLSSNLNVEHDGASWKLWVRLGSYPEAMSLAQAAGHGGR